MSQSSQNNSTSPDVIDLSASNVDQEIEEQNELSESLPSTEEVEESSSEDDDQGFQGGPPVEEMQLTQVRCDRRPMNELLQLFDTSMHGLTQVNDSVAISNFTCMSLQEYIEVMPRYCMRSHKSCERCKCLVDATKMVLSHGLIELAQVFKAVFPSVTYHSYSAKRLLGKMLVIFL